MDIRNSGFLEKQGEKGGYFSKLDQLSLIYFSHKKNDAVIKGWKKRYFDLVGGLLYYYKNKGNL